MRVILRALVTFLEVVALGIFYRTAITRHGRYEKESFTRTERTKGSNGVGCTGFAICFQESA